MLRKQLWIFVVPFIIKIKKNEICTDDLGKKQCMKS